MIDKSSLLKSQGSLYLEFIPKDGLFHKMLLLSPMGFLTGWCNLKTVLTLHARAWLLSSTISDVACSLVSKNAMPIAAVTPVEIVSPK